MRPIFIGGCDRSGTTFLAARLASREGVVALPESHFVAETAHRAAEGETARAAAARIDANHRYRAWREAGCPAAVDGVREGMESRMLLERLATIYAEKTGAGPADVFVEHAPPNIANADAIAAYFPDMKLLNIVRDGRAVAASLMPLDWGPNTIIEMARFWSRAVETGRAAVERLGPGQALTVSYERLVGETDTALAEVLRFLDLADRPARAGGTSYRPPGYSSGTHSLVRAEPTASQKDRWREKLKPRQIELFEREAGALLESLGYKCVTDVSRTRPAGRIERGAMRLSEMWRRRSNAAKYKRRHQL